MELTRKQEEGLKICIKRYLDKERYTVIAGFAGSGKSTLVKFIVAALSSCGVNPDEDICYSAYTGKACLVLQDMGNKPVKTLHKLLWKWGIDAKGRYRKTPEMHLPYKVVIIDEASMISSDLLEELFKHKEAYYIFCGDPGQLPPVYHDETGSKIDGYSLLQKPHVFLDEIMRQAQESSIIRLSMDIREGKPIRLGKENDTLIIPKKEIVTGHYEWADQIICATNKTREDINIQARLLQGKEGPPQEGDKVISANNHFDWASSINYSPIVNGTMGTLHMPYNSYVHIPKSAKNVRAWEKTPCEVIIATVKLDVDDDEFQEVVIDKQGLNTGVYSIDGQSLYKMIKNEKEYFHRIPQFWNYGYAITCHRAEGSQWNKVLVIEEKFPFDRNEHAKWLYTAVSRSAQKLVLVKEG